MMPFYQGIFLAWLFFSTVRHRRVIASGATPLCLFQITAVQGLQPTPPPKKRLTAGKCPGGRDTIEIRAQEKTAWRETNRRIRKNAAVQSSKYKAVSVLDRRFHSPPPPPSFGLGGRRMHQWIDCSIVQKDEAVF
jgi:hypothetical protein